MRHLFTLAFFIFLLGNLSAQLSLTNGTNNYLINFDATTSGVNAGAFTGGGLAPNPSTGQLDGDGWAVTGLSDATHDFGQTHTTGDFARGANNGGVGTGGLYGFDVGGGNRAIGIQPTGSDWTPGTITLKITNNSTSTINQFTVDYVVYVNNDQGRSNSFNFSHSPNNTIYSDEPSLDLISPVTADANGWVANNRNITLSNLSLNPGESHYIRWAGSDISGGGSRDEFALDDISITLTTAGNCTEPSAQPTSLTFGVVTSNSIQGTFTPASADKSLVVISTNSSLTSNPVDGVIYSPGNLLGGGEVLQYDNSSSLNAIGLNSNTTYYFFLFAANDNCNGGPDYLATGSLTGSQATTAGGSTYYNSIGNETCAALKTALHNLIKGHTTVSYASLWTHFQTTDDHLNDAGNATIVWDMYSDNPAGSENEFTFVTNQCGTYQGEGDCYNREHSWPKSWWGGGTSGPEYTDLFHLIPADGWINGIRSNNPYGEVQGGTESHITNNGTKLGSSSIPIPGYSGSVFEPIDAYKGDVARHYFYMATRYEDVIAGWETANASGDAVMDGTSYPVFEQWALDMFIAWHNADPVSQKELDRNEDIYAIQGNRNPFIDHPEWVASIWSGCSGDTEAPTAPSNLTASNITTNSVDLDWNASSDNVGVTTYNIYQDGVNVASVGGTATSTTITGLAASTAYAFHLTASDAAGNESANSNSVNVTTQTPTDSEAPTDPTSLTASNVTETATDLSWASSTDNVGVTGYNIYQDGINVASTAGTAYTVTGLTGATTYMFHVTAFDAAGNESGNSNTQSVTTETPPGGPTVLHEGYFESGWDNWTDGGGDCSRYSGSRSAEGSYSIRLRDNSGTASSMTSEVFDISSYSTIDIDFSFYPNSMENNEDFWVRYNDGSGWQTIATFVRGVDFNNNVFYAATVSIGSATYNFTNNAQFRFQCDASGNADRIYIDEVVITADAGGSNLLAPTLTEIVPSSPLITENETKQSMENEPFFEEELKEVTVYPNPASEFIHIDFSNFDIKEMSGFEVMNLMGQKIDVVVNVSLPGTVFKHDVSSYGSGLYFIKIIDDRGIQQVVKFYVN